MSERNSKKAPLHIKEFHFPTNSVQQTLDTLWKAIEHNRHRSEQPFHKTLAAQSSLATVLRNSKQIKKCCKTLRESRRRRHYKPRKVACYAFKAAQFSTAKIQSSDPVKRRSRESAREAGGSESGWSVRSGDGGKLEHDLSNSKLIDRNLNSQGAQTGYVEHLSIYAGIRSVSQEYYIDINRKVLSMWLELVEEA